HVGAPWAGSARDEIGSIQLHAGCSGTRSRRRRAACFGEYAKSWGLHAGPGIGPVPFGGPKSGQGRRNGLSRVASRSATQGTRKGWTVRLAWGRQPELQRYLLRRCSVRLFRAVSASQSSAAGSSTATPGGTASPGSISRCFARRRPFGGAVG